MAKEGINGVFGKSRTKLVKASNRLEEDAQAMEARLLQLKVTMQEEKLKRDAQLPLKHAGNRWRSAREDRGSIRQYARDVQQKKCAKNRISREGDQPSSGSTKSSKSKKSSRLKRVILSPATVEQWTIPQVLEWLTTIGLEEFQSGFEFHQVTGKMLLDMTPESCEKLGVYKLSARSRLLAEMEQIRAQQTKKQQNEGGGSAEAAEIIDPKLRDVELVPELTSPPSKLAAKTHWSHVTPLSGNAISSGDGQVPVNLADGEFNEEESHASFMKALLEWREADSNQPATTSNQDDEWINPTLSGNDCDGEKNGGALLDGTYDEQEAHNSFQEALLAWRNGGESKRSATPATAPVDQTESGCAPGERKSCWQCYRVVQVDGLIHDEQTSKSFCGTVCQTAYHEQYARFYPSSS